MGNVGVCAPITVLDLESKNDQNGYSTTRDITCFIPWVLLPLQTQVPTLPTMQLYRLHLDIYRNMILLFLIIPLTFLVTFKTFLLLYFIVYYYLHFYFYFILFFIIIHIYLFIFTLIWLKTITICGCFMDVAQSPESNVGISFFSPAKPHYIFYDSWIIYIHIYINTCYIRFTLHMYKMPCMHRDWGDDPGSLM